VYKTAILGTLAKYIFLAFYILHFAWFCLQYKATAKSHEKRTKLYNKEYIISNTY